ncbi:hypothetical protein RHECNPAF_1009 [Rhizobium etli CNPAF512]|nr:hypothetical protein RHECNPAF_1009 [Rhizobium etli CNPAF512]
MECHADAIAQFGLRNFPQQTLYADGLPDMNIHCMRFFFHFVFPPEDTEMRLFAISVSDNFYLSYTKLAIARL